MKVPSVTPAPGVIAAQGSRPKIDPVFLAMATATQAQLEKDKVNDPNSSNR